jgi:hypothetical protein
MGQGGEMSAPKIEGLGIVQDSFTMRWKATGKVEDVGWLEAWGLCSWKR